MKKVVYTLSVNGYAPEITEKTFPLMREYANKIGADFRIITKRKYSDYPPVYEKIQLYELSQENDWTIYLDADTLIHPDYPDVTALLHKDTVAFHGRDFAPVRWRYDNYFLRDGRHIGACNWFTVASDWCSDLWHPLEGSYTKAVENIFPTRKERNTIIKREHLIDDYLLSCNIARYGLKHTTIPELFIGKEFSSVSNIWHEYLLGIDEKIVLMDKVLEAWGMK